MKRNKRDNPKNADMLVQASAAVVVMAEEYTDAYDIFAMAKGGDSSPKFGALIRVEQRMLKTVRQYRKIKKRAMEARKTRP